MPLFFVPSTPEASEISSGSSNESMYEEISVEDTDTDDGDSTTSYAAKISREPMRKPFKFRSLSELNKPSKYSPTSSPIPLPSTEEFTISSDEELENSMLLMDQNVTN